jgi:HEAT repeat protein
VLRALQDPDPYVVQYAGWAAFEARDPETVPLLIRQLKNPSPVARMGVAAGLQAYSTEARRYLPQLEDALAREPEGPTRKTLEATIEKIKGRRSHTPRQQDRQSRLLSFSLTRASSSTAVPDEHAGKHGFLAPFCC